MTITDCTRQQAGEAADLLAAMIEECVAFDDAGPRMMAVVTLLVAALRVAERR